MLPERGSFRTDIEGLRGVAILLVVAFHAGVSWLGGGYVGVDVFFVLSGYLITGLLAREVVDTGGIDFPAFYARRARRLLPALIVVLLATLVITMVMYAPIDRAAIASDARAVALHYGNIVFATGAVDYHATSENPLLHTWSLAVEEQFYIVWPLLFAFIGRVWGRESEDATRNRLLLAIAITGVASLVASIWMTRVAQPWAFFGMPARIWEFAAGGVVALATINDSPKAERVGSTMQVAGLIAIGAAVLLLHEATPYPGVAAVLPVAGTAALLVGGRRAPESRIGRALGAAPLRFFGRVSYSWYLWHWPLVGVGAVIDWEIGVAGRLAWSLVALGLAVLTVRVVEEPARRGELFTSTPNRVNLAALAASVAIAAIAYGATVAAVRGASTSVQRPYAAARDDAMAHDCWGSLLENATAPCEFGDLRARSTVVLLGDSHAEHWLPAMDRLARSRGWMVVAMIKPACPVADVPELVSTRLKRFYSECTAWRRAMLRRIVAMRPTAVVLSSYDHYVARDGSGPEWKITATQWQAGLRRTYGTLGRAGINTVVIRGTPRPGFDVPSCLSRRASGAPFSGKPCEYAFDRSLVPGAVRAQNDAARGVPTLAFVDMNDRVCGSAVCPVTRGGIVVFRDDGHLTASFSRWEAPVLGTRIDAALSRLRRIRSAP
jgi:peptidoglycan/LPS O-acetylase OafA/YrhL